MKFRKPVLAAFLGFLATGAGELLSLLLVALGVAEHDVYRIDSLIVTANRYDFLLGLAVNFITGGAVAVLLNWALSRYGDDFVLSKAVMAKLAAWFLFKLYSVAFIEGRLVDPRPFGDYWVHISAAVVTGIVLGLLFRMVLSKGGLNGKGDAAV